MAEYESVIAGIDLAKDADTRKIHIKFDSSWWSDMRRECLRLRMTITRYMEEVRRRIAKIDNINFEQVPRAKNERADTLARLSSFPKINLHGRVCVEIGRAFEFVQKWSMRFVTLP